MKLLSRKFIYNALSIFFIKLIHSSIIYKLFIKFNYNFFFYLKYLFNIFFLYRFYLLSVNFNFFFIDYIYLVSYFNQLSKMNFSSYSLPIKMSSYSVLRSPFVFSKSKEQFSINYCCTFFDTELLKFSPTYFSFFKGVFCKIQLHHSKFWYKYIIKT